MPRPEPTEYAAAYAGYVDLITDQEIISVLERQIDELRSLADEINEDLGSFTYAPGKWTIKQLVGHLADGERIFAYRALRIARRDATPLPGFDQDPYIAAGRFDERPLAEIFQELIAVRRSNLFLFASLHDDDWSAVGTAADNPVSVRAIAYVMAGHIAHHLQILRERYLNRPNAV